MQHCDCDTIERITRIQELEYKLDNMRRALERIAACRGYITGDVVKIAKDALAEEKGK